MRKGTYFIQQGHDGPIKIGVTSTSPRNRLNMLQCGSPVPLRIIGFMPGDHEDRLHVLFGHLRLSSEWFANDPAIHAEIARSRRYFEFCTRIAYIESMQWHYERVVALLREVVADAPQWQEKVDNELYGFPPHCFREDSETEFSEIVLHLNDATA